jgi:GT2 family glycosyltransferase
VQHGECGVIIVNDGTHDERYAAVAADHAGLVRYLVVSKKQGPAHARNIGAHHSAAQFLVFTDDDCRPPAGWLDWLLARIETVPELDVLAGTTAPPARRGNDTVVERFNRCFKLYPKPLFAKGEMYCLPTANVAVRRSVFIQAGGFNESFRYAAGEDTEFFYRLRLKGAHFFVDLDWKTEHPIADSYSSFTRRWFRYGYGNAQHRIISGDPFENGLPLDLTPWTILRSIPSYIASRRSLASSQRARPGIPPMNTRWEPIFAILAATQRLAYLYGGYKAYREARARLSPDDSDIAASRQGSVEAAEQLGAFDQSSVSSAKTAVPPRFGLIIGAMKCGTTALFSALRQHPEVSACRLKEPPFFFDDVEFCKGENWYLDLFEFDPKRHRLAVEASPRNTMAPIHTDTAERMRRTGWAFRFIYLVRNPIERIESHYLHAAAARFGLPPPYAGLDRSVIAISSYHFQLSDYCRLFGRDSILVLRYEDWRSAPDEALRRVCAHFDIGFSSSVRLGQPIHASEFHYRRRLQIEELQTLGAAPPDLNLEMVPEVISSLPPAQRGIIEAAVDRRYKLSDLQKAEIKQALAEDMRLLARDYRIDVASWGFHA